MSFPFAGFRSFRRAVGHSHSEIEPGTSSLRWHPVTSHQGRPSVFRLPGHMHKEVGSRQSVFGSGEHQESMKYLNKSLGETSNTIVGFSLQSLNQAHKDWICDMKFLPGGNILLSSCRQGYLKMWSVDTCAQLGEIRAHNSPINAIATNSSSIFTASK